MIFTHSGNIGDVLYSIPTIRHFTSEATLYIKAAKYEQGDQYQALKDFLVQQDCIKQVLPFIPQEEIDWNWYRWPGLKSPDRRGEYFHDLDNGHDLDLARLQPSRGRTYMVQRYYNQLGITADAKVFPFLQVDDLYKRNERYALFSVSPRWNSYFYDWGKIYKQAQEKYDKIYFIGFVSEHLEFQIRYAQIEHLMADNILELARIIRDCDHLYCNQGPSVVLAQGLNKNYSLLPNHPPGSFQRTNCITGMANETILKQDYSMIK